MFCWGRGRGRREGVGILSFSSQNPSRFARKSVRTAYGDLAVTEVRLPRRLTRVDHDHERRFVHNLVRDVDVHIRFGGGAGIRIVDLLETGRACGRCQEAGAQGKVQHRDGRLMAHGGMEVMLCES